MVRLFVCIMYVCGSSGWISLCLVIWCMVLIVVSNSVLLLEFSLLFLICRCVFVVVRLIVFLVGGWIMMCMVYFSDSVYVMEVGCV